MPVPIYLLFVTLELLFAIFMFVFMVSILYSSFMGAAYVPTKKYQIDQILAEANLKSGQIFLELGCGDGRVVRRAVEKYRVLGKGIDVNPVLIFFANLRKHVKRIKNLSFERRNVFKTDLSAANIIYLFLMPEILDRLALKIRKEVKPGTLLISHGFKMISFKKNLVHEVLDRPFPTYFYKID